MPRFSLIVATIGRSEEFSKLLQSLAGQTTHDFELIVVDQNSDDRIVPLLAKWRSAIAGAFSEQAAIHRVTHLRCAPGVSRARNLGIEHSTGEILAFPDDDCWYLPDTLQRVDDWFANHPKYGILSIGSRDEQGRKSNNRWIQEECDLNKVNVFRASATYTYFVLRPASTIAAVFDESIGPASGTGFGAGEDTDFLLTLMRQGIRGRFDSRMYVGHPVKGYVDKQRAGKYGAGFGRVQVKHSLLFLCLGLVTFDFARAILYLGIGRRARASHLWAHGKAMLDAYFFDKHGPRTF